MPASHRSVRVRAAGRRAAKNTFESNVLINGIAANGEW